MYQPALPLVLLNHLDSFDSTIWLVFWYLDQLSAETTTVQEIAKTLGMSVSDVIATLNKSQAILNPPANTEAGFQENDNVSLLGEDGPREEDPKNGRTRATAVSQRV